VNSHSYDFPYIYGTAWKEDRTPELVTTALGAGFRAIDTANQRKHYFEAGVGQGLEAAYRSGLVKREDLFLQTKFTYLPGQDDRLPYDPKASLTQQVAQSMASSLEHLGTGYVDSYVLHGPASGRKWTEHDAEVWAAMVKEREAGRARVLGVSNVGLWHLEQMPEAPAFVQNRCFARFGWDRDVRAFCRERGIVYQGFSLLTANPEVVMGLFVGELAQHLKATRPQVVLRFAQKIGILPLTGTTNEQHMREDLAATSLTLPPEAVEALETIAG
jgi:diketogulonate reductase-like aldo/keto reductase